MEWGQFWVVAVVALIIGGIIGIAINSGGLTDAEVNDKIAKAVNQSVFQKNAEIETLKGLIEILENKTAEPEIIGYLIDELFLSDPFKEDVFSDREVSTLFDGEVEFDGKDYDAEETLILKNITLIANERDFEGNVYMTLLEGAIEYKLEFEDGLNTSLIDDEETLEFSFLGESYEVSEWGLTTITLTKGIEYSLKLEESVTIDEKVVLLKYVTEDAIYVEVDGVGKSIDEDKTKTVNGLEIKVKDVFDSETYSVAILVIGEEIEAEIEDGEEYVEDSPWNWVISDNSIGLILAEDFTEIDLDGDEEFPAVGVGEKLCLPNEYVCVQFNGMVEEETEEYTFELDEKGGIKYVRIEGNFIAGVEDYKRIYVNDTGIYNRDLELINSVSIELGDTESILKINIDLVLKVNDFEVNYDLNDSIVGTGDEDHLTDYGILVINPEDSADDQEFNIFVPEEKLEGSISLI